MSMWLPSCFWPPSCGSFGKKHFAYQFGAKIVKIAQVVQKDMVIRDKMMVMVSQDGRHLVFGCQ